MVELDARKLLDNMGLETAATLLDAQMERSLHAEHTYAQFLDELLPSEQQERGRKCEEMRTKLTRLPHRKSLEEFDFGFQPSIAKRQIDELATLALRPARKTSSCWGRPASEKHIWRSASP